MIVVEGLTKRYGAAVAVDDLSFEARPGRVTGFLGPNGAGKTTTLRCLLGLARPTSGRGTINGRPYAHLDEPARAVGAVLEEPAFHPGRTARAHLRVLSSAAGIPPARAAEVLALVELAGGAGTRVGRYSLGMRQRLGLAAALLGDPGVLVLDEPANGLDPHGIRWLRELLRALAGEGRTVLVSSHVLAEVAQVADDVVVISRGRLVLHSPLEGLMGGASAGVRVRSPEAEELARLMEGRGWTVTRDVTRDVSRDGPGRLVVSGARAEDVGALAAAHGIVLHELTPEGQSLERAYLELTGTEGVR